MHFDFIARLAPDLFTWGGTGDGVADFYGAHTWRYIASVHAETLQRTRGAATASPEEREEQAAVGGTGCRAEETPGIEPAHCLLHLLIVAPNRTRRLFLTDLPRALRVGGRKRTQAGLLLL